MSLVVILVLVLALFAFLVVSSRRSRTARQLLGVLVGEGTTPLAWLAMFLVRVGIAGVAGYAGGWLAFSYLNWVINSGSPAYRAWVSLGGNLQLLVGWGVGVFIGLGVFGATRLQPPR